MRALINLIKTLKGAKRQTSNAAGEERTNGGASWIQCAWADSGALRVVGDIVKTFGEYSMALPHPDGSHRLLYAPLSPESWYEDYARAQLVEGRTRHLR
jgi:hypothetical protein